MKALKYNFLFVLFVFFPHSFSQDFDPAFLASLPDAVRKDLLEEVEGREVFEQEQYRRPSSFIKKPNVDSNRFGLNIFSMMQSTLMPVNEPNFDSSYTLDFGDQLQLQLVGQTSSIVNLTINRDGSVSIPDIGKVFLSGLTMQAASELIKQKVSSSYIGVEGFVTLVNVRDIQIVVSGNVFNPGPYTLNGNSNIFHSLTVSGGPDESGSFRDIELIREGKVIEKIDLYETFIYGKPSFGTRLRSGDMVFVKPSKNIVTISGGVKRARQYELLETENFEDLIFFSNGFTSDADLSNIELEKLNNGNVEKLQLSNKDFSNVKLKDGESIFVRRYPIKVASISGAVNNPGTYRFNEGEGLFELINRAGGYTETAYSFGGILLNEQALEANLLAKEQLYRSFLSSLIKSTASLQAGSAETVGALLSELKDSPVSGRISAEFDLEKISNNKNLNTPLKDGDEIFIPEKVDHLYIFGEVSNQGTIRFYEKENLGFYIKSKGGLTDNADINNIFILHPNGVSEKVQRKNVFRDGNSKIKLYPGSIIFVPKKPDNIFFTQSMQAYATILGNLGVSLASLSVLKD